MPNVVDSRTGEVVKKFGYTEDDRDAAEAFASRSEHYEVKDLSVKHGLGGHSRNEDRSERPHMFVKKGTDVYGDRDAQETEPSRVTDIISSMFKGAGLPNVLGARTADPVAPTVPGGNPIGVNRRPITSVDPAVAQRAMQMGQDQTSWSQNVLQKPPSVDDRAFYDRDRGRPGYHASRPEESLQSRVGPGGEASAGRAVPPSQHANVDLGLLRRHGNPRPILERQVGGRTQGIRDPAGLMEQTGIGQDKFGVRMTNEGLRRRTQPTSYDNFSRGSSLGGSPRVGHPDLPTAQGVLNRNLQPVGGSKTLSRPPLTQDRVQRGFVEDRQNNRFNPEKIENRLRRQGSKRRRIMENEKSPSGRVPY